MKCNPDPLAPHGFNRNASHNEGRYVCECESWDKDDKGRVAKFKCEFCGEISVTIHINEEKTKTWAECSNCTAKSY